MSKDAGAELRERLSVQPPSELVEYLNILVYGEPGAGKTYLAGTSEDGLATSPVLFLDVEGGVTTLRSRTGLDVKPIRSLDDIEQTYDELFKSVEKNKLYYKTVVIDSLSELADLDMRVIMQQAFNRNPEKVDKDVPSQREWGISRSHMRKIVRAFRDLPCNVILTAHAGLSQEEGQPTGYFPAFSGKLRSEIPGFMDVVGYLYVETPRAGEIVRRVQFAKTRRIVAKDRTGALGEFVDNPTIPQLFDLIHGKEVKPDA